MARFLCGRSGHTQTSLTNVHSTLYVTHMIPLFHCVEKAGQDLQTRLSVTSISIIICAHFVATSICLIVIVNAIISIEFKVSNSYYQQHEVQITSAVLVLQPNSDSTCKVSFIQDT